MHAWAPRHPEDAEAQFFWAMLIYGNPVEYGVKPDGFEQPLRRAADAGYAPAQGRLGLELITGERIKADAAEGWRLIEAAMKAEDRDAFAYAGIGSMFGLGGRRPDLAAAERHLLRAKELGNRRGASWLALVYASTGRKKEAEQILADGAAEGNDGATLKLAEWKLIGWSGDEADVNGAIRLFREAAKRGNAEAMRRLGNLSRWGVGTAPDEAQAAKWFAKAAKRGETESRYELATMQLVGSGVPQDVDAALAELESLARQGHARATLALARVYLEGVWVERDPRRTQELLRTISAKSFEARAYLERLSEPRSP